MNMPDIPQLQQAIHMSLKCWTAIDKPVPELLQTLLVVKQQGQGNCLHGDMISWHRAVNEVLLAGIVVLEQESESEAAVLRQRFLQGLPAKMVAYEINLDRDRLNRVQRKAITRLAQILWAQEAATRTHYLADMGSRLPNATHPLFGIEEHLQELTRRVIMPGEPWTIVVTGIGGIGKTSLAAAVAREVLSQFIFEGVIWVKVGEDQEMEHVVFSQLAQQLGVSPHLPLAEKTQAVRHVLQQCPYLIVFDNVEVESELIELLQQVGDLANPGKFLITSRVRPPEVVVWSWGMEDLSLTAVSRLINHLTTANNYAAFIMPSDEEIAAIYSMTGGNPLAVKLVTGLMAVAPLPVLLAELQTAAMPPTKVVYRHIYWRVWHSLSPEAQAILLLLLLAAGSGFSANHMLAVSKLPSGTFWSAVNLLISRSLLEVCHEKPEWRYGIHRLTASFLQIDIAQL